MNLNNEEYKVLRKKTEKKLKDYPYYIMSIEMPDLRGGAGFGEVTSKTNKVQVYKILLWILIIWKI